MINPLVQDKIVSNDQLAIVEKYEDFTNYAYGFARNFPRIHNVVKDSFLKLMFEQVELFVQAGKSDQISRLYQADAGLGVLRFYLRFMVHKDRKLITKDQFRVASIHLAETGKMLGGWINKMNGKGAERKAARTITPATPVPGT